MTRNAASWDRGLRALAGVALMVGASVAPLPVPFVVRVLVGGSMGAYLLGTAVVGSCLGYKLMGISTCPASANGKVT
jgi:hypothetical protein